MSRHGASALGGAFAAVCASSAANAALRFAAAQRAACGDWISSWKSFAVPGSVTVL